MKNALTLVVLVLVAMLTTVVPVSAQHHGGYRNEPTMRRDTTDWVARATRNNSVQVHRIGRGEYRNQRSYRARHYHPTYGYECFAWESGCGPYRFGYRYPWTSWTGETIAGNQPTFSEAADAIDARTAQRPIPPESTEKEVLPQASAPQKKDIPYTIVNRTGKPVCVDGKRIEVNAVGFVNNHDTIAVTPVPGDTICSVSAKFLDDNHLELVCSQKGR